MPTPSNPIHTSANALDEWANAKSPNATALAASPMRSATAWP